MQIEDKILINEIKKGNIAVYESLFAEYYPGLVRFAQGFLFDQQESEDLVQNLFIHIWEHATKIEIHSSIKAYFFQSVRNRCINHLKSLSIKDKKNLLYYEAMMNSEDEVTFFDPKILADIRESIAELPEQMAKAINLWLLNGLKQDQIALEMNISVNTVKTQLKRAKDRLRKNLLNKTNLTFLLL